MFIDEVTSSGPMPALEMMMKFAGARQRVIADNIANLDTPGHQSLDASPVRFQAALRDAVEKRRARNGGAFGALDWKDTDEVQAVGGGGPLVLTPTTPSGNVMGHDRNNGDLERSMQDLVENVSTFRVAADLLRGRGEILRQAMSERI